ncbi:MAG: cytochrome c biogenesis protein ResB [Planctomycetota bacterium]|nr:cytochrome c biogenesis protein ResB [Planctomycetota bacterium]
MNKFRREIMWAALVLIVVLTAMSIYGAFIGTERAQVFFNSVPSTVFWALFLLALVGGFVAFRRLIRVPGLLLMHAGCILILIGGSLGSEKGYKATGNENIREGQMQIYEGQTTNQVFVQKKDGEGHDMKELPFSIKLNDFRIEYYDYEPPYLEVETADGRALRVPAEVGQEIDLGGKLGTAKITRKFEHFKMSLEDGKQVPFEDLHGNPMPALEVRITPPEGEVTTRYTFALMPGFGHTQGGPTLTYVKPVGGAISDYISELEVTDKDGKVLAKKDIEVNHPLQYGGYRFYQSSYDAKAGRYTVLQVVSDTGVRIVFAGYWMLCIGVTWHMWLRHLFKNIGSKKQTDGN